MSLSPEIQQEGDRINRGIEGRGRASGKGIALRVAIIIIPCAADQKEQAKLRLHMCVQVKVCLYS